MTPAPATRGLQPEHVSGLHTHTHFAPDVQNPAPRPAHQPAVEAAQLGAVTEDSEYTSSDGDSYSSEDDRSEVQ